MPYEMKILPMTLRLPLADLPRCTLTPLTLRSGRITSGYLVRAHALTQIRLRATSDIRHPLHAIALMEGDKR